MPATLPLLAAAPAPPDVRSLVLVLAASTLGAILSRIHHRVVLPTVVVEIVLGILIGPQVLGWASVDSYIDFLSNFGLVFLFFFAGLEVVEKHVPRRAVARGTLGWAGSLALGCAIGYALHAGGLNAEGWLIGVALATTALGTLVPVLSRRGPAADAARPRRPGHGRGRRVLADRRDLRLPHGRLRRQDRGDPARRLRRASSPAPP